MKKILLLIIPALFIIQTCIAQTANPPLLLKEWERIYIKNVGSFDLPPTMEIQKGKYKEFVDEIKNIKGIDATQITAQQKGLNDLTKVGKEKYARVILNTTFGSVGDFNLLNFNISEFSQKDINKLDSVFKNEVQINLLSNVFLVEWYPLKVESVNGMSCIHIHYTRQLQNSPIVLVHIYYFFNNDRMHSLTLSYRLSESKYWKQDFDKILKSFRITNIR